MITSSKSFDQLNTWRSEFLGQATPKDADNFPFVCVGNKLDRDEDRSVAKSKATAWCKSKTLKPIPYYETSAKDSVNVEAAFYETAQLALNKEAAESEVFIPDTINLSNLNNKKTQSAGCC